MRVESSTPSATAVDGVSICDGALATAGQLSLLILIYFKGILVNLFYCTSFLLLIVLACLLCGLLGMLRLGWACRVSTIKHA